MDLREQLGDIDIYLLDQLLKGRLPPGSSVLDAGCGGGRNLIYLLRNGYPVFGVDENPRAVSQVRELAAQLATDLPSDNFQVAGLTEIPFPDRRFDAVICSAVLHFARDEAQFDRMLAEILAGPPARRSLLRETGFDDRNRKTRPQPRRETVPASRRLGALSRGRAHAPPGRRAARRDLDRAVQDPPSSRIRDR